MNPFEDDKNRRNRKDPFDFYGIDDEFERIFRHMEQMWKKAFQDYPFDNLEPGKSYIHGFNIHMGPDGKPKVHEFGHQPQKITDEKYSVTDEREPITDVIEGDEDISITVEIPGIEKNDIDLNLTETKLEITLNDSERRYHKVIDLPCNVSPEKSTATYNNGVLDVIIKRKERKKDSEGYHVDIE